MFSVLVSSNYKYKLTILSLNSNQSNLISFAQLYLTWWWFSSIFKNRTNFSFLINIYIHIVIVILSSRQYDDNDYRTLSSTICHTLIVLCCPFEYVFSIIYECMYVRLRVCSSLHVLCVCMFLSLDRNLFKTDHAQQWWRNFFCLHSLFAICIFTRLLCLYATVSPMFFIPNRYSFIPDLYKEQLLGNL